MQQHGSKRLVTMASRTANCASIVHKLAALNLQPVASWTKTANSSKLCALEAGVHVKSVACRAILQTRQAVNLRNTVLLQRVRQHPNIVTQSVEPDVRIRVGCVRLRHLQTHAQSGVHVLRSSAADPTHDQERCTGGDDLGQCLSVRWNCRAFHPYYARQGPMW